MLTEAYLFGRILREMLICEPLKNDQFDDDLPENFDPNDPQYYYSSLLSTSESPPEYLKPSQMSITYIVYFLLQGFGATSVGFSSTYYATKCGEISWSIIY